ncbi:PRTRC system protein B [Dysgonomonas sp. ZJ709]|uniref:PRTRC system protein B n=1 Tax=Dysgonomonas sp. ZJ709 TaxID=2709797 RepID=UPI0013ECACA1|nr:PRTRC system protein B [Dysgonomonas sp. ZJ709]
MNYTTAEIVNKSKVTYTPRMAIIVYATKDKDYYLESRSIHASGTMGSAVPLTKNCIAEIAKLFSEDQAVTPHGNIPKNMLFADNRIGYQRYIWFNPPEKRKMFFAKSLAIPDEEYHIPGIIYVVEEDRLNLYAFKGKYPKNELYVAPFLNTTNGSVCLGSAKLNYPNNPTYADFIAYWEKKFWLTEFTHLGGSENPTKNNLITIIKSSVDSFDMKELLPSGKKLKDLLK